jgi:hypothetical protein
MASETRAAPARTPGFDELSIVTLGKRVETPRGSLPAGASGTIVHAYDDGIAYIIEFYEPFHTVATVEADAIAV